MRGSRTMSIEQSCRANEKRETKMALEKTRQMMRASTAAAASLALLLAACGSSNLFSTSALDLFNTSSKATTANAGGGPDTTTDVECPSVSVRTGAATLMIGSKPAEGEPSALDLRYQATIVRTARECQVNAGIMNMKVGIEGRVITGPAGGPGTVDVPLRIAVVHEGVNPKTIVSRFGQVQVGVASGVDRVPFTHVESEISFPLPQPLTNIDSYVVYVGFDPAGAQEKKKPAGKPKPKPKTVAKPRQS
jgi:hypothetical protein